MKIKCENGEVWISAIGVLSLEEAEQLGKDLLGLVAHEKAHAKRRREERILNLLKDCEINNEACAALFEDTPIVVDGEEVGVWGGGGMSPAAILEFYRLLEEKANG